MIVTADGYQEEVLPPLRSQILVEVVYGVLIKYFSPLALTIKVK